MCQAGFRAHRERAAAVVRIGSNRDQGQAGGAGARGPGAGQSAAGGDGRPAHTVRLLILTGRVASLPVPVRVRGAMAVRAAGTCTGGVEEHAGGETGAVARQTGFAGEAAAHRRAPGSGRCGAGRMRNPHRAGAAAAASWRAASTHLLQLGDQGLDLVDRAGQRLDLGLQLVDLGLQLGRGRGGGGRGAGQQGGERHKGDGDPAGGGHQGGGAWVWWACAPIRMVRAAAWCKSSCQCACMHGAQAGCMPSLEAGCCQQQGARLQLTSW